MAELNQMADLLRDQTQDLRHAVTTLQETNRLASLRIAMLGSMLADLTQGRGGKPVGRKRATRRVRCAKISNHCRRARIINCG